MTGGAFQQQRPIRRALALARRIQRPGKGLFERLARSDTFTGRDEGLEFLISGPDIGATLAQLLAAAEVSKPTHRHLRTVAPDLSHHTPNAGKDLTGQPTKTAVNRAVPSPISRLRQGSKPMSDTAAATANERTDPQPAKLKPPSLNDIAEMRQHQRRQKTVDTHHKIAPAPKTEVSAEKQPAQMVTADETTRQTSGYKSLAEFAGSHIGSVNTPPYIAERASAQTLKSEQPANTRLGVQPHADDSKLANAVGTTPFFPKGATHQRQIDPFSPTASANTTSATFPVLPHPADAQRTHTRENLSRAKTQQLTDTDNDLAEVAWRNGVEPQ